MFRRRPPAVVPALCCPSCGKRSFAAELRRGEGMFVCERARCGQRWWAMALSPGAVEPQLAEVFTPPIARWLRVQYQLPHALGEPAFWQLALTGREMHTHRHSATRDLFAALGLTPEHAV